MLKYFILFLSLISLKADSFINASATSANAIEPYYVTNSVSVCCWINIVTVNAGNFVCQNNINVFGGSSYNLRANDVNTNTLEFYFINDSTAEAEVYTSAPDVATGCINSWHHFAVTYTYGDGSSIKMYLDGIQLTGCGWTSLDGSGHPFITDGPLLIGSDSVTTFYNGYMSELACWRDTILTPNEIKRLAKSGLKGMPNFIHRDTLCYYYPLDEGRNQGLIANNRRNIRNAGPFKLTLKPNLIRGSLEQILSYPPNE